MKGGDRVSAIAAAIVVLLLVWGNAIYKNYSKKKEE